MGNVAAVYDMIGRVLNGAPHPFKLYLLEGQDDDFYFQLQDHIGTHKDRILVTATTASDLSAGVGWYLRHYANLTYGWPRGGGTRIFLPPEWPKIGPTLVRKKRQVPWSYLMVRERSGGENWASVCSDFFHSDFSSFLPLPFIKNVCTHSYSLVWYSWKDWEQFIDWLALSGINNILALTGQEQVQYQVFRQLGLQDEDIRSWFNGPALLTWSRGQNEYGSNICGPLPKSWMKDQYDLQRNYILPRLRSLGIVGQLPGFQGNVPIQLKSLYKDSNITQQGMTGWMDALDPLYSKIADLWMKELIEAFGTDHWYQLDGYFNGGTAPWMLYEEGMLDKKGLEGFSAPMHHDEAWYQRGLAAYQGLNRTDPDAVWSFQGFSFIHWNDTNGQGLGLKGFVDAAPPGHFVVIDMSFQGMGEWQKFQNASFYGAPFIWTTLHDFGGTDGIKGDIRRLNRIPFDLLGHASIAGLGGTPEGIDQNPTYYDFLFESNYRDAPVTDLTKHMSQHKLRQYGVDKSCYPAIARHIEKSWALLMQSLYSDERSVFDLTAIGHLQPRESLFEKDRYTPQPMMCQVYQAWKHLLMAVQEADHASIDIFRNNNEPFRYDLVNLGREVLAQLSCPAAQNFSDATKQDPILREDAFKKGLFYIELLSDVDTLVQADQAFLLGPWIESAKAWGEEEADDCYSSILNSTNCRRFYEWNARTQITTWNPTRKDSPKVPEGPLDYASKHWAGLIRDYYGVRANILLRQSLKDQAVNRTLNQTEVDRLVAKHAYQWTTATNPYTTTIIGDGIKVSIDMFDTYKHWFSSCEAGRNASISESRQTGIFLTS